MHFETWSKRQRKFIYDNVSYCGKCRVICMWCIRLYQSERDGGFHPTGCKCWGCYKMKNHSKLTKLVVTSTGK